MSKHLFVWPLFFCLAFLSGRAQNVFINEFHYDNVGTDANEGIEIAGPAGTSLNCYQLLLYNGGTGNTYNTLTLSGTIPDLCNGFGTVFFPTSLQNGPDGFALVLDSTVCFGSAPPIVIQFLSYEGSFVANNGAAVGMTSDSLPTDEATPVPVGSSVQLTGNGNSYPDFTWAINSSSHNAINSGQSFNGACAAIVATQLSFFQEPTGCILSSDNFGLNVCGTNGGGAIDGSFNETVTLTVQSGPGNLVGSNSVTAVGGCASFSGLSFDAPGTYVLTATSTSFTQSSSNIYISAQCSTCPSLTGSVIDACGSNEGRNEILFFYSGDYAVPLSYPDFNLTYGASSPPATSYSNGFSSNAAYVANLNTTAGCTIFQDAAGMNAIPPNSAFMLMRSNPDFTYDFSPWCGQTVYAVFVTDANWVEIGNFKNCVDCGAGQNGNDPRFFRTDFSSLSNGASCDFTYSYTPCTDLVCPGLGTGNSSGDGVHWPYGGGGIDSAWNQCTPDLLTLLPVEYELPLQGYREGDRVRLNWSTASEQQAAHFVVERKDAYSGDFLPIGQQNAIGNAQQATYYSFFDHLPPSGTLYYRLRQVDVNGEFAYSQVLAIKPFVGHFTPSVALSPQGDWIEFGLPDEGLARIRILDLNGRLLHAETDIDLRQKAQVRLRTDAFASGLYLYEIGLAGQLFTGKFIIQ